MRTPCGAPVVSCARVGPAVIEAAIAVASQQAIQLSSQYLRIEAERDGEHVLVEPIRQ
jgi:hypothetical protein